LPVIGQYDSYPHCYVIMAYGDNGTVYNGVFAKIVTDNIVHGSSPDMDLYLQNRPFVEKMTL